MSSCMEFLVKWSFGMLGWLNLRSLHVVVFSRGEYDGRQFFMYRYLDMEERILPNGFYSCADAAEDRWTPILLILGETCFELFFLYVTYCHFPGMYWYGSDWLKMWYPYEFGTGEVSDLDIHTNILPRKRDASCAILIDQQLPTGSLKVNIRSMVTFVSARK